MDGMVSIAERIEDAKERYVLISPTSIFASLGSCFVATAGYYARGHTLFEDV